MLLALEYETLTNFDKVFARSYESFKKWRKIFCLEFSKVENELLKIIYKNTPI